MNVGMKKEPYKLHQLKIDNGVFLDEIKINGIKELSLDENARGQGVATLTISLDVVTKKQNANKLGACILP